MNRGSIREWIGPKSTWSAAGVAAALVLLSPAPGAAQSYKGAPQGNDSPNPVQIVALDECDPESFNKDPHPSDANPNPGLGPDFCRNVALAPLGFATTLQSLFDQAA